MKKISKAIKAAYEILRLKVIEDNAFDIDDSAEAVSEMEQHAVIIAKIIIELKNDLEQLEVGFAERMKNIQKTQDIIDKLKKEKEIAYEEIKTLTNKLNEEIKQKKELQIEKGKLFNDLYNEVHDAYFCAFNDRTVKEHGDLCTRIRELRKAENELDLFKEQLYSDDPGSVIGIEKAIKENSKLREEIGNLKIEIRNLKDENTIFKNRVYDLNVCFQKERNKDENKQNKCNQCLLIKAANNVLIEPVENIFLISTLFVQHPKLAVSICNLQNVLNKIGGNKNG